MSSPPCHISYAISTGKPLDWLRVYCDENFTCNRLVIVATIAIMIRFESHSRNHSNRIRCGSLSWMAIVALVIINSTGLISVRWNLSALGNAQHHTLCGCVNVGWCQAIPVHAKRTKNVHIEKRQSHFYPNQSFTSHFSSGRFSPSLHAACGVTGWGDSHIQIDDFKWISGCTQVQDDTKRLAGCSHSLSPWWCIFGCQINIDDCSHSWLRTDGIVVSSSPSVRHDTWHRLHICHCAIFGGFLPTIQQWNEPHGGRSSNMNVILCHDLPNGRRITRNLLCRTQTLSNPTTQRQPSSRRFILSVRFQAKSLPFQIGKKLCKSFSTSQRGAFKFDNVALCTRLLLRFVFGSRCCRMFSVDFIVFAVWRRTQIRLFSDADELSVFIVHERIHERRDDNDDDTNDMHSILNASKYRKVN